MIKCKCGNSRFTTSVILFIDGSLDAIEHDGQNKVFFNADTLCEEVMNDGMRVQCIECGEPYKISGWDRIMM